MSYYWTIAFYEYKGRPNLKDGKIEYPSKSAAEKALAIAERNGWRGSIAQWKKNPMNQFGRKKRTLSPAQAQALAYGRKKMAALRKSPLKRTLRTVEKAATSKIWRDSHIHLRAGEKTIAMFPNTTEGNKRAKEFAKFYARKHRVSLSAILK